MLLAAGRGTRLAPLTSAAPKCLLPVAGRPLLDHQLDALAAVGIDDVTIVAGYRADAIERHARDRARVIVNHRFDSTGSIASLALAEAHLRGHAFLLQNADTLYTTDLLRRFLSAPCGSACLVHAPAPYRPGEYHIEVAAGRITRYAQAVPAERSVGESAQLLRIAAPDSVPFFDRLAEILAARGPGGFPNQAYDVLIAAQRLSPVFTAGLPWWEIDSPSDLERCHAEFESLLDVLRARAAGASRRSRARALPGVRLARRIASIKWARFRWVPPTLAPITRHPLRVGREIGKFLGGTLSLRGLDLAANGEHFLRLAFHDADAVALRLMLAWGTLLGCIRQGGFIPGDHDIDLAVMAPDAQRLPAWRDRMLRRGFTIRIQNDCKLSLVHPRHPRLFIDIDIIHPHRDGWAISNTNADPTRHFVYHFPHAVFARTRAATFLHSLRVHVPGDAEGFLSAVYGDWRTPAPKVDYRYGPLNTEVDVLPAGSPRGVALPEVVLTAAAGQPVSALRV